MFLVQITMYIAVTISSLVLSGKYALVRNVYVNMAFPYFKK